jgi:Phytanoyl-CoA dioxygenase (PhyH)
VAGGSTWKSWGAKLHQAVRPRSGDAATAAGNLVEGRRDIDADGLAATGRLIEAVDLAAAAYRTSADSTLAIRLVDLRQEAMRLLAPGPGRTPWPPTYSDPYPDVSGRLPEIGVAELTTDALGGAVAHHGAVIVRGMFDDAQVCRTLDAVRQAQAWRDERPAEESGWYRPFPTTNGMTEALRQRAAAAGGTWLADSPVAAARVLDDLASVGAIDVIHRHLGERPCFSLQKSTLRRIPAKQGLATWHQDGSFLDADVRSMNVWIALSRCGGDYPSPGLEVIPRRIPELLPVQDSLSPYSVSFELISEMASETPTIRPEFEPGDALMFDERFLHRTYLDHVMTEPRYALECWFFAPSHSPSSYIPFLA